MFSGVICLILQNKCRAYYQTSPCGGWGEFHLDLLSNEEKSNCLRFCWNIQFAPFIFGRYIKIDFFFLRGKLHKDRLIYR